MWIQNDFLPGRLRLSRGKPKDYRALARFHYRSKQPATWDQVWTVRYLDRSDSECNRRVAEAPRKTQRRERAKAIDSLGAFLCVSASGRLHFPPSKSPGRIVAVGVLSFPLPSSLSRRDALGIRGTQRSELRFANRHIRTISRVIVHPQFRSLGLSKLLIGCLCRHCKTRYVEALAMMGRAHPLFDRAGMRRVEPRSRDSPVYFIFDRQSGRRSRSHLD
jgi:hypothetical protein